MQDLHLHLKTSYYLQDLLVSQYWIIHKIDFLCKIELHQMHMKNVL
jgi:hypothetical protein